MTETRRGFLGWLAGAFAAAPMLPQLSDGFRKTPSSEDWRYVVRCANIDFLVMPPLENEPSSILPGSVTYVSGFEYSPRFTVRG